MKAGVSGSPMSQSSGSLASISRRPMTYQTQAIQWARSAKADMSSVSTTALHCEYRSTFCSSRSSRSSRTVFSRCTSEVCGRVWGRLSEAQPLRASRAPPPGPRPHQRPWGQGKLQQEEHLCSLGRVARKRRGWETSTKTNNGQHFVSTYHVSGLRYVLQSSFKKLSFQSSYHPGSQFADK